jgi:general secretion pathway protein A
LAQLRQRISIVQGLAPLPAWEVKNYVEHRLRIAGYQGGPIFSNQAYESIAVASEGIPRNVNNFCFNALSLACALRKRTVDAEVVKEVMADLDLQKLTWSVPEGATVARPFDGVPVMAKSTAEPEVRQEITNAAEAAAYMQQVALKLRSWRESMDKASGTTSQVKN